MKQQTRSPKSYPNWRQRERRMLVWALAVGGVASVITGVLIYFISRNNSGN